jgi:hypothetical protein
VTGPALVQLDNGTYTQSTEETLMAYENHYGKLLSEIPSSTPHYKALPVTTQIQRNEITDDLLAPIATNEVEKMLNLMAKKKAPGPDSIPTEVWQRVSPDLLESISSLFNESIPQPLKQGRIISIHKSGNPLELNNYRGITLLNTLYKCFSKIIAARLQNALSSRNLFSKGQIGFRANQSIQYHLQTARAVLEDAKDTPREIHYLYLDLVKAFDTVPHDRLLSTLKLYFNDEAILLFKSIITGSTCDAITPHGITSPFPVTRGVKQGDPLSPLLFIILMESLMKKLESLDIGYTPSHSNEKIPAQAFADDLLLLANNRAAIETIFRETKKFLVCNLIEINPKKSAYGANNTNPS